ncbi:MAG: hypothetical protein M3044_03075 [Thermoproteota archaeon]|nr:hypothetical protein [Thermoproteota archaeon]
MNKLGLALGIAISFAALLVSLNTTPNVAKAYSCSSSTSTIRGNSATTSVSGSSGSCATGSASTSTANSPGGFIRNGSPPNFDGRSSANVGIGPGTSDSFSAGGTQSNCVATSGPIPGPDRISGATTITDSQHGSCSAHSPP